ncbi:cytochrome P450 [Dactylosporangium matsuzakiense]|nr:cytochrome P450 [Dactylosporangium matsuzakiense]
MIDFDFSSPEYARRWPDIYAELREHAPVAYSSRHGGFWVVSSSALARQVARDPATFSSDHDPTGERTGYRGVGIPHSVGTRSLPQEADPPESTFYRRLMSPWFSQTAVARWEPWLTRLAEHLIGAKLPEGRLDVADDLAFPAPAMLVTALLGLPVDDWRELVDPFHTLVTRRPGDPEHARAEAGLTEVLRLVADTVARRRHEPGEDLLSGLVAARPGGRRLSDEQIVSIAQLVFFGGVDSTTALVTSAVHRLDTHPAERARLTGEPGLLGAATEEYLRWFSPIHLNGRTVTTDVTLGGCPLKAGDRLLIAWAGANRDPATAAEPERVVLDRPDNRHLAFGAGVHHCLGAHFARMMFRVVFSALLRHVPDFRVDHAGAERYPSVGQVNGFSHLPVTFTPRAARGGAGPLPAPPAGGAGAEPPP